MPILTPLALLLLTAAACNEAGGDAVLGPSTAESVEEGIELAADPAQILLDPNDPNAPRDPNTNKLIGSTTITATVRNALLEPQAGVQVTFTKTKGTLASGGQPLTTDAEGKVVETLSVTEDDAGDVEVTAVSGGYTETIVVPVVLVPLNVPPTADAGDDATFECPEVALDGSGSTDANSTEGTNDDIVLYEWFLEGEKIAEGVRRRSTCLPRRKVNPSPLLQPFRSSSSACRRAACRNRPSSFSARRATASR